MLDADQQVGVAAVPLNVTVLLPLVAPKFAPLIATDVPTAPLVGERLVTDGAVLVAVVTVNASALLLAPPTFTTTLPLVAPVGTGTTMFDADQLVGVAVVPLNVTVLLACVAPKLLPAIVTDVPTGPVVGDKEVSDGDAVADPPDTTTLLNEAVAAVDVL